MSWLIALWWLALPATAPGGSEDAPPKVMAVLPAQPSGGASADLARTLTEVLRARAGEVRRVRLIAGPALALADLQLALGCTGEGHACLGAIAEQLKVEALTLPRVHASGETLILTLGLFDVGRSGPLERWTGQASGAEAAAQIAGLAGEGVQALLGEAPEPAVSPTRRPGPACSPPEVTTVDAPGGSPRGDRGER